MKQWMVLPVAVLLVVGAGAQAPVVPFHKGVNLSAWFQPEQVGRLAFSRYSEQDFRDLKTLGADGVRLPINFAALTGPAPDYRIDARVFVFLDQALDWAAGQEIAVVLDNHSDPTDPRIKSDLGRFLEKVWTQMGEHYKTRPLTVLYEVQNEPNHLDQAWAPLQQRAINAIRAVDSVHTIVVGGDDWNSIKGMKALPKYSDSNLVYTFHFYDPLIFTHQGADWTGLKDLAGVSFPPKGQPPEFHPTGPNAWTANALRDYYKSNILSDMTASMDAAAAFSKERGVPVWCGEFGVYSLVADPVQRVNWYRVVRGLLEERHIPWTMWDYKDAFGLFQKGTAAVFDQDLNLPLVAAQGFNTVPQRPAGPRTETAGFVLYNDSWQSESREEAYAPKGTVDYADTVNPHSGRYSIKLEALARYSNVGWQFAPWKDLTGLVDKASLSLWMRASKPFSLQARFVDGATSDSPPWRLTTDIGTAQVPADGQWHRVVVPLASMVITGAYDGTWHQGKAGDFNWSRVERLELSAENANLDATVHVDDVEVVLK